MSIKLTPWFPAEIKPVRTGAYWVTHHSWTPNVFDAWAYWNGKEWSDSVASPTCPGKKLFSFTIQDRYQDKSWRGLAKEPK